MKRDVIIACFSIPAQKAGRVLVDGANWEGNAPYVWNFQDDQDDKAQIRDKAFISAARKIRAAALAKGGTGLVPYILNDAMRLGKFTQVGRVALVTFSAGNSAARFIMANPSDQQLIDTFISLDSTMFQRQPDGSVAEPNAEGMGWYQYAAYGISGFDASSMSIYLHTDIINKDPSVLSTGDSAKMVFAELRRLQDSMASVRDWSIPSPLDFNPLYELPRLNNSPRLWATSGENITEIDRVGNNIRLRLPSPAAPSAKCLGYKVTTAAGCAHVACANDFQRAIYDTFLAPRWRNPEKFSCLGPECIRPFTPTTPLSGFGAYGSFTETTVVPTSKEVNMAALTAQWDAMGLPRWDLIYSGAAAVGAAALAGAVSYFFLKD